MRRQTGSGRNGAFLNPFVVLTDVMISVVLILIFYFTALLMITRAHSADAEKLRHEAEIIKIQEAADRTQIAQLNKNLAQVRRDVAEKQEKIDRYKQLVSDTLTQSNDLRHYPGQLAIRSEGDSQVLSFDTKALFVVNQAKLQGTSGFFLQVLADELAKALKIGAERYGTYPEIQVQGHTDTKVGDNWTLSMNRALAVLQVMNSRPALKREYLSAAGYSCHRPRVDPRAPGWDSAQAAHEDREGPNRRIEIRLWYHLRPLYNPTFVPNQPFDCGCDVAQTSGGR